MRIRMLVAVAIVAVVFAGACANATSGGEGSHGPSDGDSISYPTGADQLVLRIDQGGGFVTPQAILTQFPLFSLLGDGLVVGPGAQIEIYPGPALPAAVQQRLSPEAIEQLLSAARDAGLFEARDFTDLGSVGIADAATTTFTVIADGHTAVTHVYALGELQQKPAGMSTGEFDARQRLVAFEAKAMDLSWLPPGSVSDHGPYRPTGLRVYVSDYQPSEDLHESPIAWPLDPPLATFGDPVAQGGLQGTRCGVATGTDLDTLLPLVERANELTPWSSDGARFGLLIRPLMPDETGCS